MAAAPGMRTWMSSNAIDPYCFPSLTACSAAPSRLEDILQEAYIRYQSVDPDAVQSPKALLTTIVTRLC